MIVFGGILVHYLCFSFQQKSSQTNEATPTPPFRWRTENRGSIPKSTFLGDAKIWIFSAFGAVSSYLFWGCLVWVCDMKNKHLRMSTTGGFLYNVRHIPTWYRNPFSRRCLKKWAVLVNQQQKLGRDMSGDTVFRNPAWNHGRIWNIYQYYPYQLVQVGSANGLLPIFYQYFFHQP